MTYQQAAHEKLNRYYQEAEIYRKLPRIGWRALAAERLRTVAESLEREATPKVGGRTFG